jgi:hypothetical protein
MSSIESKGTAIPPVYFWRRGNVGRGMQENPGSSVSHGGILAMIVAPGPWNTAIASFVPKWVQAGGNK